MDPYAPIILPVSGSPFDASGLVNKYSFQAEIEEIDGGNGGITLSGKSVKDILALHLRLSWTLNSMPETRVAALNAALDSGPYPDTVNALAFDPTHNLYCYGPFRVERPEWIFALDADGIRFAQAGAQLILTQVSALAYTDTREVPQS